MRLEEVTDEISHQMKDRRVCATTSQITRQGLCHGHIFKTLITQILFSINVTPERST